MSNRTVERYLTIFDLLTQVPGGLTRQQLRSMVPEYENAVSESAFIRMFERDKATLRDLGLLEEQAETRSGVSPKYRAKPVQSDELPDSASSFRGATTLGLLAQAWQPGDVAKFLQRTLHKLGWIPAYQESPATLAGALLEEPNLLTVATAAAEHRNISFKYLDNSRGTYSARSLNVLGLGYRYHRWYLLGVESTDPDKTVKKFRLDRAQRVQLGETFEADYPEFSAKQVLSTVAAVDPQQVNYLNSSNGEIETRASYSAEESAAEAIELGLVPLGAPNDSESYQMRVRLLFLAHLNRLLDKHQAEEISHKQLSFQPIGKQRERMSSEDKTLQLLSIAHFAVDNPGIKLKELVRHFSMGPTAMRNQLDLLLVSFGEENFGYFEDDGCIFAHASAPIQQAVQLTDAEVYLLLLTLRVLRETTTYTQALDEAELLLTVLSSKTRLLRDRLATIQDSDQLETLKDAIEYGDSLSVTYTSHRATSQRTIKPLEIFTDLNTHYLRAYCFTQQDFRVFRIEALSINAIDDHSQNTIPHKKLEEWAPPTDTPRDWITQTAQGSAVIATDPSEINTVAIQLLESYASEKASDGKRTYYRMPLTHEDWLLKQTLRHAGEWELTSPAHLREEITAHATMLLQKVESET